MSRASIRNKATRDDENSPWVISGKPPPRSGGTALKNQHANNLAVDVGDGVAVLELEVALGLRVPLLGRGVRLAALGASVVRACNGTSQAQATTKTMRFCYGYGHGRWTSGTSVR